MPETRFVTFYSYKGGVGRTLALANVAWIAASEGKRVVIVDFDLEAPGIPSIPSFRESVQEHLKEEKNGGLFEMALYFQDQREMPSLRKIRDVFSTRPIKDEFGNGGEISIIPAGREDDNYKNKLQSFDWNKFYEKESGKSFFTEFRENIDEAFGCPDIVLFDSRTGLTDLGAICTHLLPDILVIISGLNTQNIGGSKTIMSSISEKIEIVTVVSHVPRSEKAKDTINERLEYARKELGREIDVIFPYEPVLSLEERILSKKDTDEKELESVIISRYSDLYYKIVKKSTFQLLHISDLHIEVSEGFDRSLVLDPLIDQIRRDIQNGFRPELLIVTGDIAKRGLREEYEAAKEFFDELLACLDLSRENLFVVPGNHDVNRSKFRPADTIPCYTNMRDLNEELENEYYRADLFKGMEEYFDFVEDNYRHLKSNHGRLVPFAYLYEAHCEKKIGLVGLNSAWMSRTSPDEKKVAIGEFQIKKAMAELDQYGHIDLRINIFHHPLSWLWPEDRKICKQYFDDSILLTGHLHDSEAVSIEDLDVKLYQFQAGGAYLGSDSRWSAGFHYVTLDWENNFMRLDFREYKDRSWSIAETIGVNGKKEFPLSGAKRDDIQKTFVEQQEKEREQKNKFSDYINYALNEHRHLPTQGFETNFRTPIEIEQVYIHMRGNIHGYEHGYNMEDRERMQERIERDRLESLDIKGAFQALEQCHIKDMVVLGDPGSGKTTLLKYILVILADEKGMDKLGIRNKTIPFFAPLRDRKVSEGEDLVGFLIRVCKLERFSINHNDLEELLKSGDAIVLLDGLDEVADREKRIETCKWIDEERGRFPRIRFVITSRFAGYMEKSRLEGGVMELSIQDFTTDEVQAFLTRWFESVEVALHPGAEEGEWREKGREDAQKLIQDIINLEYLMKLAKNPLILQIIALVNRDRGRLPQRRVELYDECTNVLLEKWDMAKGLDVLLSAREARAILQPLALWLHGVVDRRSAGLEEIKEVIKGPLEELGKSDLNPEELLKNIRDRSGIFMGYSESEYGFTHLSFQEYLSAEEIRNLGEIRKLSDNYSARWWREVILLCLALDNPSVIEEFMELIIPSEQFKRGDIGIVLDAIEDSIKKPSGTFLRVAKDEAQLIEIRQKAIDVLSQTKTGKVIDELKKLVNQREQSIALTAYQALETLNATADVKKPSVEGREEKIKHKKDSSEMVLIPGGDFMYGSREDDKIADSNEKPQKVIGLPDFYIDVYPVTNDQYCAFLNAVKPKSDELESWIYLKGKYKKEKCRVSKKEGVYIVEEGFGDHPVIYVYWQGADSYANWAGKRLPTEQEWEKAARGPDGRVYPWGEEFKNGLCNSDESGIGHTTPVDKYTKGKSRHGCYDMSGNVWEWTSSLYKEDEDWHTIRGGSWYSSRKTCRCAARDYGFDLFIRFNYADVGFRCART
ncbi:MAG: SUMF1/EgtB/PvdO family nonheme iron enzyme [Candidatus Brocadiaceae bacterium]|nr:SUMF1/EgtB/PvdO family nonheme iron enzyme [Candidatus Brocadiaceae bacterium]